MDVIEFRENKLGELIAYENSIPLSDTSHSQKQAEHWLSLIPLNIRRIVVVGIGSGFHVKALVASGRFDQIDVVDCRPALVGGLAQRLGLSKSDFHAHLYEEEEALLASDLFEYVIQEQVPVYFFADSFAQHKDELFRFVQILTGRSKKSLDKVFATLGLDIEIEERSGDLGNWLSIKDLGVIVDTQNVGHPSASAIRILRELVT